MALLELIILLLALCCAPYMLARALGLPKPPTPAALWHIVAPVVVPVVELLGYGFKRSIAYKWEPTPEDRPRLLHPYMSSNIRDDDEDDAVVPPVAPLANDLANGIAMPQNGNNDAVVIAALARLVAAGKLGQTDAIKLGIGITPSSTSVRYQAIRNDLRVEVERLKGAEKPQFRTTDEQVQWRRSMGLEEA